MMYEGFSANLSFTGLIGKFVQEKTRAETGWPNMHRRGLVAAHHGPWPRSGEEAKAGPLA